MMSTIDPTANSLCSSLLIESTSSSTGSSIILPYFQEKPNPALYTEALLLAAENKFEDAKRVLETGDRISTKTPFEKLLDQIFLNLTAKNPEDLSFLGLFEAINVKDHNQCLNDCSIEAKLKRLEEVKSIFQVFKEIPLSSLSKDEILTHQIIDWKLQHEIKGESFLFHGYTLTQKNGRIQDLARTFINFHKLQNSEDIENYLIRLSQVPEQLNQAAITFRFQLEKKIVPPRFALEKVIKIISSFAPNDAKRHLFYTHLKAALEKMNLSQDYLQKAEELLKERVIPAYDQLKKLIEESLEIATENQGVWALPEGDSYYEYMLKTHTTTNLTPEEIHNLGLTQVEGILKEMAAILEQEGIDCKQTTVGERIQELSKDERFFYPNNEEGKQACLAGYQEILDRSRIELASYFDLKPSAPVEIKQVPKHEEEGAPQAYYFSPSVDGSRPGAFFANLRDMSEVPKFGMETLVIHEAEPGHHFQLAIQNESPSHILRKLSHYTAYIEGWALYTEKFAYEKGFYSSPYAKLGHLQDELLRAVRLVVDTGIHKKRWSREYAIHYMQGITGYALNSVVTEVERYFVMPGQACSYKIGQLKLLELRKKAKDRLGDRFDIRLFHNAVLAGGAVPLEILETVLDSY